VTLNRYKPHVVVIPEDRANEELVNGFLLSNDLQQRAITVLAPVGGWAKVVDRFLDEYQPKMDVYQGQRVVLLLDFDGQPERRDRIHAQIDELCKERVFVIGSLSDPESVRRVLEKSFEDIGATLADECRDETWELWNHELLKHNENELKRLSASVRPFLFKGVDPEP
jgi:hypothetical protein